MSLVRSLAGIAIFCGVISAVTAQQPQVPTTVQLPTFSQFTVVTTVSVPDGGTAYLGGIGRGSDSNITRGIGPLRNRGLSSSRGASGVSVSATIIDHEEIDRAILTEAAAKRKPADTALAKAATISKSVAVEPGRALRTASPPTAALPGSVAAIREQNAIAADLEAAELAGYLAKGRQAEAENKPGVAKVYYQMVARRDKGRMKQQAVERLAVLSPPAAAKR